MLLQLYDLNHTRIAGLKNHKDATVESELSSGDKTLSFLWHKRNKQTIPQEYYVRTDTDEYVVKENSASSNGYRKIIAKLNIEEIEGRSWSEYIVNGVTAQEAADYALTDTGWSCVSTVPAEKLRNINLKNVSSYQIIEKILEAYTCEVKFDTFNKRVYLKTQIGEDRGAYFIEGLNLKEITESSDTYDYATIIVPIGADGLGIEIANNGKNYLENYQYSSKRKSVIWEDSNYTDPWALKEDAEYRLSEISKPKRTLRAKTIDLAKTSQKYEALSYSVGDVATFISLDNGIKEKQRITKTTEYLENPEKNTCDISNTVLSFEEMQKKLFAAAQCIDNIIIGNGTVNGSSVDKIDVTQIIGLERYIAEDIDDLRVNYLYARSEFGTPYAVIGQAILTDTQTTNLTVQGREDVEESHINTLYAETMYGTNAVFKTIESDNIAALEARINKIVSTDITVEYLEANYAQIDFANVTIESVATLFADVGLITDATVVDGHITGFLDAVSVNADNITVGTLAVDRLVIRGSQQSLVYEMNNISGALQAVSVDTLNGEIITPRTINCDRIVAESITGNEIAAETITSEKIVTRSITADRLKANSITAGEIASGAITSGKIEAGAITAEHIAAHAITADRLAAKTITSDYIAAGTITGNEIEAGSITADKIKVSELSALTANLGTVTAGVIQSSNYAAGSYGMRLRLGDGTWDSKNFKLDSQGNVSANSALLVDGIYGTYSKNGVIQTNMNSQVLSFTIAEALERVTSAIQSDGFAIKMTGSVIGVYACQNNFLSQCAFNGPVSMKNYARFDGETYFSGTATYTDLVANRISVGSMATGSIVTSGGATIASDGNIWSPCWGDWLSNTLNNKQSNLGFTPIQQGGGANQGTNKVYIGWGWDGKLHLQVDATDLGAFALEKDMANFSVNYATYAGNLRANSTGRCLVVTNDNFLRIRLNGAGENGTVSVGSANYRFSQLFVTAASISTSDRNEKDNIKPLTDKHTRFLMLLMPVSFSFRTGTSGRTHIGFIAQDVEDAMLQVGLTSLDFAGFCKDQKMVEYVDADGNTAERAVYDDSGNPEYIYSLRYEEFIALTVHTLQETIKQQQLQDMSITTMQNQINAIMFDLEMQRMAIDRLAGAAA